MPLSKAGEAGGWSDNDLEDIVEGGGYKPDKNKGGGGYGSNDDPGSGISTETGTIAGVASALAMALIGAVSSYFVADLPTLDHSGEAARTDAGRLHRLPSQ